MGRALILLLDTNILIVVLRGEAISLAWLEQQEHPAISVISSIEVLVGCHGGESDRVKAWLGTFPRLPISTSPPATAVISRSRWEGCCTLPSSESL